MKPLVFLSLLLCLAACNSESKSTDSTDQQSDSTTASELAPTEGSGLSLVAGHIAPISYHFKLKPLGENEQGTPHTQVYIEYEKAGELITQPIIKVMGDVQALEENQYAQYKIPASARQPHYSFWAGLGHAFYIDQPEGGPITVKETFQDEADEATAHRVVITLEE